MRRSARKLVELSWIAAGGVPGSGMDLMASKADVIDAELAALRANVHVQAPPQWPEWVTAEQRTAIEAEHTRISHVYKEALATTNVLYTSALKDAFVRVDTALLDALVRRMA